MRNSIPFALAVALSACGGADPVDASRPSQQPAATAAAIEPTSMLGVGPPTVRRVSTCTGIPAETEIRVEDTSRGAALVFITDEDIAALREQIGTRLTSFAWANAHLDNVDQGVRIVFESAEGNQHEIRASVMQRGRELTKVCGLEWNIPEDKPDAPATASASAASASAAPAKPEPSASNESSKPPPPVSSSTKDPKDDSKKDKPATSAKPTEPKPPEKPVLKPKGDNKPKPPPLPPPELPPPPPPPPPKQPF